MLTTLNLLTLQCICIDISLCLTVYFFLQNYWKTHSYISSIDFHRTIVHIELYYASLIYFSSITKFILILEFVFQPIVIFSCTNETRPIANCKLYITTLELSNNKHHKILNLILYSILELQHNLFPFSSSQ